MADSRMIADLDMKLMEDDIIDPAYRDDYQIVHDMLNTHVRKTGKILSEETFDTGDKALRKWLMTLYKQGASQEKLTSYLRCGLAHLSFDFIESTYQSIALDDLITRALQSFKLRNFHAAYFKVAPTGLRKKSAVAKKMTPAKKKPAVKKKAAAKKKPAVKKKATPKKPVKKKAAPPKKKAVKKTVKKTAAKSTAKAKKKPVRKAAGAGAKKKPSTARKAAVKKKPIAKKGAVKKAAAKKSSKRKPKAKKGLLSRIFG